MCKLEQYRANSRRRVMRNCFLSSCNCMNGYWHWAGIHFFPHKKIASYVLKQCSLNSSYRSIPTFVAFCERYSLSHLVTVFETEWIITHEDVYCKSHCLRKLAAICVSISWRILKNKNNSAMYQPWIINGFLYWLAYSKCAVFAINFAIPSCINRGEGERISEQSSETEMGKRLVSFHIHRVWNSWNEQYYLR